MSNINDHKKTTGPLQGGGKFRFLRQDKIGVPDAEEDQNFLTNCFVDTGDLEILMDCSEAPRIVLGRTGSGKTALLNRLSDESTTAIPIKPETLALNFISNSTMLNFLMRLNVKLDVFFKLLWRHVFTVEVLQSHFKINDDNTQISFLEKLKNFFRDEGHGKNRDKAVMFIEHWGKSYWKDTEFRIREVMENFESELKDSIGTTVDPICLTSQGIDLMDHEQKEEVAYRAQKVVNDVHVKELSEVIDLMGDVLEKSQTNYYIVIDRLDENWIDDKLRYLLIRALIETVRDFKKAKHVKIIVALRYDLIDRVFRYTRDAGFQEEKYESLYLHLKWNRERLTEILDSRINFLVKKRNPKQVISHQDVLPRTIGKEDTLDYIIDRTLMRPRDIIFFFNHCIERATGCSRITQDMVRQAEGEYSRSRTRSLYDEWKADYPNLEKFTELLKGLKPQQTLRDIAEEECADFCLRFCVEGGCPNDELAEAAHKFMDSKITVANFRRKVIQIFYHVGLVGLKLERHEGTVWSFDGRRSVSEAEIDPETRVSIHPCFWRTLGIQERLPS